MSKNILRRNYAFCSACGARVEIRNGRLSRHMDQFAPLTWCSRGGQSPELNEAVRV